MKKTKQKKDAKREAINDIVEATGLKKITIQKLFALCDSFEALSAPIEKNVWCVF
jgi:hypothetical protein